MPMQALAVDVGATKVALALVDEDFTIAHSREVQVHNNSNLWEEIADATQELLKTVNGSLLGVGIGSAGPLKVREGLVSPVNIPQWREFPIVEKFASLTKNLNVVLHGDAMAMVHAESRLGAGVGIPNLLGIVVSTGIGGGLILRNQLHLGDTGNSFFIGHHTINFDGPECACGRRGCVETYASGPRMVEAAQALGWGVNEKRFEALAESARDGNAIALQVIDEGARALAIGIINSVGSLDLKTVVVGGGVAQAGEIYWEPLLRHIKNEAQFIDFLSDVELRPARLHKDAGILGAALAVMDSSSG